MDFYVFRVGEKIHEDFYPALVQSGARLIQDKEGGLYLLLVFDSPSAEELEAVKRGKIRSYVLTDSSESFWFGMFKLQAGLSFDCTYNVLKNSPLEWEKRSNFFQAVQPAAHLTGRSADPNTQRPTSRDHAKAFSRISLQHVAGGNQQQRYGILAPLRRVAQLVVQIPDRRIDDAWD